MRRILALALFCSACGGNVREAALPDVMDQAAVTRVAQQLSPEGNPSEAMLFQQWAFQERAVKQGLRPDDTPQVTPRNVQEAVAEQRERHRREGAARAAQRAQNARVEADNLRIMTNNARIERQANGEVSIATRMFFEDRHLPIP